MDLSKELEKFGFSAKETKVYLANLRLGPSSITEIAKTAGLKRPTVYLTIEDLIEKGIIHKTISGKRVYYLASKPEDLISFLENKLSAVKNILPELQAILPSPTGQPQIRFYQNKSGLKNIYEEIFSSSSNIRTIVSLDKFFEIFSEKENAYLFELLKKSGGRLYDSIEFSPQAKSHKEAAYRKGLGQAKILPKNFKITTDILVFGNKIAMISFENLTGLIIENRELAQTQKQLLKFLWQNCK